MTGKTCSKCKKPKPRNDFNKDRHAKSQRRSECIECQRKNRREHFEEDAARSKRYYFRNREQIIEKTKLYNKTHKKRRAEVMRRHYLKCREKDKKYALAQKLHKHICRALHGGESQMALSLLDCKGEEFRGYIESLFKPGMTWLNHSREGWHLHCIKPCSLFDLSDLVQQKACFNYKNLKPLWSEDNLRKGKNYVA